MYVGETKLKKHSRHIARGSGMTSYGKEKRLMDAIVAHGNKLTYKFISFERSEDDREMIKAIEQCIFEVFEMMDWLRYLHNEHTGNKDARNTKITKNFLDASVRAKIGLAIIVQIFASDSRMKTTTHDLTYPCITNNCNHLAKDAKTALKHFRDCHLQQIAQKSSTKFDNETEDLTHSKTLCLPTSSSHDGGGVVVVPIVNGKHNQEWNKESGLIKIVTE